LVEALSLAASRVIQVEEGELAGNWSPVQASKHHEVDLFFYDLLPGGAGYARLMAEEVNAVFEEAARLLDGCTCESSCYQCLRHYGNVMVHRSLDRRLGASLLGYICTGRAPRLDPTKKSKALLPLVELLAVQGYDIKSDEDGPIEVSRKLGEAVLVDVYPALVEPTQFCSSARSKAWQAKKRFAALDEYVLAHDLPEAFRRVQSCGAGAPSIEFEQVKGLGEVGQVAECSLREWDDSGNPKVLRQLPVDGAVEGCFVARLEGGLERLYDPGSLGLFRHVHSHDDLPPRDSLVLVRHPDLCDPDLGAVTVRRFRWSERHDSDGQATHVKLELRPYTTERERYRTQYLEIPVEEWSGWRPVAVLTRVVDGQTSERRSNSTSGGTD
ncbi:MAG: DUF1998 domain-containing protein, partial [Candidatus Eremiobacteraeota bacterium]|nr:DUF1998 domain-containing protein [Candidatus Eremiobacteraeota bacterium]